MDEQQAYSRLLSIHQTHVLEGWQQLSKPEQKHLLSQIASLNLDMFHLQQQLLNEPIQQRHLSPFTSYVRAGNSADKEHGLSLIAQGKVGCLIIAGGQGSRLGAHQPKGTFPVTKDGKSLFQLFAERSLYMGKQVQRDLSIAIMTSPLNHNDTIAFFQQHDFFGLKEDNISFFSQSTLPFLDEAGNLIKTAPGAIACGPDGNGEALQCFFNSNTWQKWHHAGICYLNFVLIDNALALPFDPELVGYHARSKDDIIVKCTEKRSGEENVGVLAIENDRLTVVEYSEMSMTERTATTPEGRLLYPCANISLFSFTMDFIKRLATLPSQSLPLHKALKKIHPSDPNSRKAWKFERFIFDVLAYTTKIGALMYPREQCFAPLKSLEGDDGITAVQQALEKGRL